jgi:hypothetical protein
MQQWDSVVASTASAKALHVPVALDDASVLRDCVLVTIAPISSLERLGSASGFRVDVHDVVGRSRLAERLCRNVVRLLSSDPEAKTVELTQHAPQATASPFERGFVMLGLMVRSVLLGAGLDFHDPQQPDFVPKVRKSLGAAFAALRGEADKTGNRDVLSQLSTEESCRSWLKVLSAPVQVDAPQASVAALSQHQRSRTVEVMSFQPLRILSWNISGKTTSARAPKSFGLPDKNAAVQLEVASRWKPDILTLQECVGPDSLPGLLDAYVFVGAARAEHCGYIHLYVRKGLAAEVLPTPSDCPAVLARITVCKGSVLDVAAVHLMPGPSAKEHRKSQVRAALQGLRPGSQVVLGDMNVRPEELQELLAMGSFRDAEYAGRSWHPAKNRYDVAGQADLYRGPGFAFDRVFFAGALHAETFLVGQGRVYSEGVHFSLSDHFAVLGLLDVHACHGAASRGSALGRERRGALVSMRDHACQQEQCEVQELSRAGRQEAARHWAATDAKAHEAALRDQRAQVKERREQREALRQVAFGADSLFDDSLPEGAAPQRAVDICPLTLRAPVLPELVCLPGDRLQSSTNAFVQVLCRLSKVAAWLQQHVCDRGPANCVACAMAAWSANPGVAEARAIQGQRVFQTARPFPHLAPALVDDLRLADRWPCGSAGGASQDGSPASMVDSLFTFVQEVRSKCPACGHRCTSYEHTTLLDLPAPSETAKQHFLLDLYLLRCAPEVATQAAPCRSEVCQGTLVRHMVQRRLVHLPEVLLVSLGSRGQRDAKGRYAVRAEDSVSLPGCGNAELAAAIYAVAGGTKHAHYVCAVRGPDACFWLFGEGKPPRRLSMEVADLCRHTAELFVYLPTGSHLAASNDFQVPCKSAVSREAGRPAAAACGIRDAAAGGILAAAGAGSSVRTPVPPELPEAFRKSRKRVAASSDETELAKGVGAGGLENPYWFLRQAALGDTRSAHARSSAARAAASTGGATPHTLLWTQLTEKCRPPIPSSVASMVLDGLERAVGKPTALKLARAPWVKDLANWRNLALEVEQVRAGPCPPAPGIYNAIVCECVFAATRLIAQQQAATLPTSASDQEKREEFLASGWLWREAAAWDENDCLADSLLQLLHLHGLVLAGPKGVGEASVRERKEGCSAARQHLLRSPSLMPRNQYGRAQWDAYLQHHRHAAALVEFFLERYPPGRAQIPPGGLALVVHARYDTPQVPPDSILLRAGAPRQQAPPMEMHVFNWTGSGLAGYHYDALVPPVLMASEPASVDLTGAVGAEQGPPAARPSRLKRVTGDGKGRAVPAASAARCPVSLQSPASAAGAAGSSQQGRAPLVLSPSPARQAHAASAAGTGAGIADRSQPKARSKAKAKAKGRQEKAPPR